MRIDKFLSEMGVATRGEARAAAKRGGVVVDGVAVKDTAKHINPDEARVVYLGREVEYKPYVYVMLHKPEGYVSATEDAHLPVVTELLPDELRRRDLFPVGRLDKDTTGLMLLSDDGKLAHALLSPRHHVKKEYYFTAAEPLRSGVEEYFRSGVVLRDGYECKSAEIRLDEDRLGGIIALTEGKYHQIKRMLGAVDNRVVTLKRISFAKIPLDTGLAPGEWRFLTDEEIARLRAAAE